MNLLEAYLKASKAPTDIHEHLPVLLGLAADCNFIVELGFRSGRSSLALMLGAATVISIDIEPCQQAVETIKPLGRGRWHFWRGDSRTIVIPDCDMLFIDTYHSGAQLSIELERHHHRVARIIAMHDTEAFKDKGEGGGEGLKPAILRFLKAHPEWEWRLSLPNNNGLTVLRRAHA